MANPYLGEIRIFAGNFAPTGWALCNGQLLSISQNTALFSILGTTYGGDGRSTFALPNFQGNVPMHAGSGAGLTPHVLGETGGVTTVTLLSNQIPSHSHTFNCSSGTKGETNVVTGNLLADEKTGTITTYATSTDGTRMNPNTLQTTPASQPHDNMQPYLGLTFIIALRGVFPSRN
jgi:microcystin-dependent protein